MRRTALNPLTWATLPWVWLLAGCGGDSTGPGNDGGTPQDTLTISFVRSTQTFPSGETVQITLGDVDDDGDLDAVFANMGLHTSTVWINDGSGSFTDSGQELTQQGHGASFGDLDGDGDDDLFMTSATYESGGQSYNQPSRIYLNDGTGVFSDSGQDLGDTELSGNGITLVDIDSDGDLDAHVFYYDGTAFFHRLYRNNGSGVFQLWPNTLPAGATLTWAKLDGDADVDLFVAEPGSGFRVLLNDGTGSFSERWASTEPSVMFGSAVTGDLDSDGDLDVLTTNWSATSVDSVRVFLNDGTGQLSEADGRLSPVLDGSLLLGDVDGDGDLDLFACAFQAPNRVWLNQGGGHFLDAGLNLGGNEPNAVGAMGDLDGDGDPDVFVPYRLPNGSNSVWFNHSGQ